MDVQGHCEPRFAEVAEAFERNFVERGEVGASVAITVRGETVVDLWGGHKDFDRTRPWDKDTLCVLMSCTKGATSLCAHLLASAGELDFGHDVARDFAALLWLLISPRALLVFDLGRWRFPLLRHLPPVLQDPESNLGGIARQARRRGRGT